MKGQHHASSQPRDARGRFAEVGDKVRGPNGGYGYITGMSPDGRWEIEDGAGRKHTVPSTDVRKVPEGTKALLPVGLAPMKDPTGRVEQYLKWAETQPSQAAGKDTPR